MERKPNLLIDNNVSITGLARLIINQNYISDSEDFLASKNRGTKIKRLDDSYHFVAWHKSVARFNRSDQFLPLPVEFFIDQDRNIRDIQIDQKSVGSQGFTCSMGYLNRNLREKLIGEHFSWDNYKKFLSSQLHCFHLQEVLLGALSFFDQFQLEGGNEFDEVEAAESIVEDEVLKLISLQQFSNNQTFEWKLYTSNINNIQFNSDGYIETIDNVSMYLYIQDSLVHQEKMQTEGVKVSSEGITRLAYKCWELLSKEVFKDGRIQFCHSCSYPMILIGLLILGIAKVRYKNSYNHFQNVARAIQRKDGMPLCVGMIDDFDEAKKYYPKLQVTDLYE